MGSAAREVEFKFAVADEQAFERLAAGLGTSLAAAEVRRQVNHFFDTPGLALAAAGWAVRLREERSRVIWTVKGPARGNAPAELSVRPELEGELEAGSLAPWLAGEADPLGPLARRDDELHARLQALIGTTPLRPVGSFENLRRRLGPLALPGAGVELLFELDRTEFRPDRTDFEIEVELPAELATEAVRSALHALLKRCGIEWSVAESKAARLFRSLQPVDEVEP